MSYFDKLTESEKMQAIVSASELGAGDRYYMKEFEARKEAAAKSIVSNKQATAASIAHSTSLLLPLIAKATEEAKQGASSNPITVTGCTGAVYVGEANSGRDVVLTPPSAAIEKQSEAKRVKSDHGGFKSESETNKRVKSHRGGFKPKVRTPKKARFSPTVKHSVRTSPKPIVTTWEDRLKETKDLDVAKEIGERALLENRELRKSDFAVRQEFRSEMDRVRRGRNEAHGHAMRYKKERDAARAQVKLLEAELELANQASS